MVQEDFLLVDGYNIIHAWDELKELMQDVSLESARQKLMDILSNYKGVRKTTIILGRVLKLPTCVQSANLVK